MGVVDDVVVVAVAVAIVGPAAVHDRRRLKRAVTAQALAHVCRNASGVELHVVVAPREECAQRVRPPKEGGAHQQLPVVRHDLGQWLAVHLGPSKGNMRACPVFVREGLVVHAQNNATHVVVLDGLLCRRVGVVERLSGRRHREGTGTQRRVQNGRVKGALRRGGAHHNGVDVLPC